MSDTIETKKCKDCEETLPIDRFAKSYNRGTTRSYCKKCEYHRRVNSLEIKKMWNVLKMYEPKPIGPRKKTLVETMER